MQPRASIAILLCLLSLSACGGREEHASESSVVPDSEVTDELARLRNLGKAFYENPTTQYEAIDVLRSAWELAPESTCDRANYGMALLRAGEEEKGVVELEAVQAADPQLPHSWFNLGVAYKRTAQYERALEQFERMVELVPNEPISRFNLGTLYKLAGRLEEAREELETAARLDPNLAAPLFHLASIFRQQGAAEREEEAMQRFRKLKRQNEGAAVSEDLEWSFYAELCERIDPAHAPSPGDPATLAFEVTTLLDGIEASRAGIELFDLGSDGSTEILVHDPGGVRLVDQTGEILEVGLGELSGVLDIASGDVDDDGLMDLALLLPPGPVLLLQRDGAFVRDETSLWPRGTFRSLLWLDWDHDYDLDLFLLGAEPRLLRNDGKLPDADAPDWSDRTASFPFVAGEITSGAVFDFEPDTQGQELVTLDAAGQATLYRDRLAGVYEPKPLTACPEGSDSILPFDLDNDSRTDLLVSGREGVTWLRNQATGFVAHPLSALKTTTLAMADLENRGLSDLVTAAGALRNQGLGELAEPSRPAGFAEAPVALVSSDLDRDGRVDLVSLDANGRLELLLNRTETAHQFVLLSFTGRKNLKLAPGSEVEVKAGRLYQKKAYDGLPLHFGLGAYSEIDTVRLTWPNGLIQNESRQPAGQSHRYEEAQRLSGSCPMIYTWDGESFRFITDVLGVAPLGASAGDGETFPVDHDEHIQIPGDALVERDGRLEIRIVEELREVAYLDEIQLIAVDREADLDLFVNDKFQGPPFPHELTLYGARERLHPLSAIDHRGRDVLDRVMARDQRYPDSFSRSRSAVAEMHTLELDFGDVAADNQAVLVLDGWVDWADGSTFLATSQNPGAELVTPYLEVLDAAGEWQVVVPDMGMPAGKPKAIVVDLRDRFLSESRRVRITTNVCVYWDEIFLAEDALDPAVRRTALHPDEATLRFAGFSRPVLHPERKQPESFVYADRSSTSMWNPTKGLYTRYGDVRGLLDTVDDRFVIMGSGDEVQLLFDVSRLPALEPGQRRDWVLKVDGWAKDGDANTIDSQTVGPLPFHGMPAYPYDAPHRYPDTPAHREVLETLHTRPALVLTRPLVEEARGGPESQRRTGSSRELGSVDP